MPKFNFSLQVWGYKNAYVEAKDKAEAFEKFRKRDFTEIEAEPYELQIDWDGVRQQLEQGTLEAYDENGEEIYEEE
jgi:hypothetical protein